MKKILFALGTRPELIKIAPLIKVVKASQKFEVITLASGQHARLFSMFLDFFQISIDDNLGSMENSTDLASTMSFMVSEYGKRFKTIKPSLVVVHGDTITALSAALAAMANEVPVAHIEAGLRTYDLNSPYPEEYNRQLISRIASINLCPTHQAKQNLISEGVDPAKCHITGNTVVDSLNFTLKKLNAPDLTKELYDKYSFIPKDFILVTAHRRENRAHKLAELAKAMKNFSKIFPKSQFLLPVHKNPSVKNLVSEHFEPLDNVRIIEPLPYVDMVYIMSKSKFIITDSGGIQEEVPTLSKLAVVCRDTTERPEVLESGHCYLAGETAESMLETMLKVNDLLMKETLLKNNPYGNGDACSKILEIIEKFLICKK
jgi:UDP-N-acetylglucosamine 2-epimerase (non-hydrolysing)